MYDDVLFPTDGCENAEAAFEHALSLAERYDPYSEIIEYSGTNADLIVMGTRGRSGLDRYLLGSVTEKVVRTANVPVFTVRGGNR